MEWCIQSICCSIHHWNNCVERICYRRTSFWLRWVCIIYVYPRKLCKTIKCKIENMFDLRLFRWYILWCFCQECRDVWGQAIYPSLLTNICKEGKLSEMKLPFIMNLPNHRNYEEKVILYVAMLMATIFSVHWEYNYILRRGLTAISLNTNHTIQGYPNFLHLKPFVRLNWTFDQTRN